MGDWDNYDDNGSSAFSTAGSHRSQTAHRYTQNKSNPHQSHAVPSDRKRPREEGAEQHGDAAPVVRKKKRGGKSAREKELKWKLANGFAVEGPAPGSSEEASIERKEGAAKNIENGRDAENTNVEDATDSTPLDNIPASTHRPPRPPKTPKPRPSKTAGLPSWIAHPLTIPSHITATPDNITTHPQWGLSPRIIARLHSKHITHLFPVQMAVLPRLLQTRYSSAAIPPGDLCVSAPTGSGKTLAYALPIVETLIGRMVPRVRALIVLPTRDLAAQVKVTFDMLLRGTDVRAILITGQTAFATEQAQLVANEEWDVVTEENGSSRVDIVIATPGRLIDHLKGTKGFTLRHLRFLVIDEADRLLNQSYQDWLIHVLQAAEQPARDAPPVAVPTDLQSSHWARLGFKVNDLHLPVHSVQTHRHALSSTAVATSTSTDTTQLATPHFIHHYTPLQKLLFSATLTRNPAKIASLHLYNPTYVAVAASQDTTTETASATTTPVTDEARYVAPSTLEERMIVCDSAGDKPLTLLHVLYNLNAKGVLVFTKSVEAAHRLAALIQIFDRARRKEKEADTDSSSSSSDSDSDSNQPDTTPSSRTITSPAHAFSSDLPPSTRKRLLHSFQTGSTSALICSDVMARGMDLGSSVHHVINYDIPTRIKTYVHRIGRTARAGREGTAWSILEPREVRWFKGEIGKVEREGRKVRRIKVGMEETGNLVKGYSRALAELGGLVKGMEGKDRKEKVRKEVEAKGNSKTKEVDIESSSDSSSSSTSSSDDSDSSDSDTDSDSSATSTISSSSSSPSTSNPTHPSSTNDDNHHRDEPAYTATHTHTTITTPIMKANTTRLEDALQRVANLISPLQTQHQRMGAGEWWDEDA